MFRENLERDLDNVNEKLGSIIETLDEAFGRIQFICTRLEAIEKNLGLEVQYYEN